MSVSMPAAELGYDLRIPDSVSDLPAATTPRASLSFARQVAIVREMLPTLDTLTAAGQRFNMDKVAKFVQHHVSDRVRHVNGRNGGALSELATVLKRECERPLPEVEAFKARADSVLALLLAVG